VVVDVVVEVVDVVVLEVVDVEVLPAAEAPAAEALESEPGEPSRLNTTSVTDAPATATAKAVPTSNL
jgi:hypothetical protein